MTEHGIIAHGNDKICLTLGIKACISLKDFLINKLKILMLQGAPPVSEGSHTGALEV